MENRAGFRWWLVMVGVLALGLARSVAAAEPRYSLSYLAPLDGGFYTQYTLKNTRVALNLPYAELPEADRKLVHSWYEEMADGDEPPFPLKGLQDIYGPIQKAQAKLRENGSLFVVARIDVDGKAQTIRVFKTPNEEMAKFAAQLLVLTEFKPASCSGQPCEMDFPLRMNFSLD